MARAVTGRAATPQRDGPPGGMPRRGSARAARPRWALGTVGASGRSARLDAAMAATPNDEPPRVGPSSRRSPVTPSPSLARRRRPGVLAPPHPVPTSKVAGKVRGMATPVFPTRVLGTSWCNVTTSGSRRGSSAPGRPAAAPRWRTASTPGLVPPARHCAAVPRNPPDASPCATRCVEAVAINPRIAERATATSHHAAAPKLGVGRRKAACASRRQPPFGAHRAATRRRAVRFQLLADRALERLEDGHVTHAGAPVRRRPKKRRHHHTSNSPSPLSPPPSAQPPPPSSPVSPVPAPVPVPPVAGAGASVVRARHDGHGRQLRIAVAHGAQRRVDGVAVLGSSPVQDSVLVAPAVTVAVRASA